MLKFDREYYGNEKERSFNAWHYDYLDRARCVGKWEMPELKPCAVVPTRLIGFNYSGSCQRFDRGVHFYLNDYRILHIIWQWTRRAKNSQKHGVLMDNTISHKIPANHAAKTGGQQCRY